MSRLMSTLRVAILRLAIIGHGNATNRGVVKVVCRPIIRFVRQCIVKNLALGLLHQV